MPNHTDNRVILSHDDTQMIDMIYNTMNTEDTPLCQTLIPMDEALLDGEGWYDWCIENWGTKWEIYNATCDRMDANTLVLDFYTAWSPPFPIFDKLVGMGFEVNARYLDEGWMYIGEYNSDGDHVHFDNVEDVVTEYPELDFEFDIGEKLEREQRRLFDDIGMTCWWASECTDMWGDKLEQYLRNKYGDKTMDMYYENQRLEEQLEEEQWMRDSGDPHYGDPESKELA